MEKEERGEGKGEKRREGEEKEGGRRKEEKRRRGKRRGGEELGGEMAQRDRETDYYLSVLAPSSGYVP